MDPSSGKKLGRFQSSIVEYVWTKVYSLAIKEIKEVSTSPPTITLFDPRLESKL
uniref:Uncharacterized protein n=1 Tax=Lepeophtheirus salmonis TaxID=72036 RepID=A0A0K2TZM1_LEPSM